MAKYIKTVAIEAEQFDGSQEVMNKYHIIWGYLDNEWEQLINTLEGRLIIRAGSGTGNQA